VPTTLLNVHPKHILDLRHCDRYVVMVKIQFSVRH
jgi:hypothetical protein